jgi:cytochrome oxidase assembly protein ShyY1
VATAADSVALYSVRWLDADSIAALLPYPVATYVLRQRPGPGVPDLPRRSARPLYDENVHLTYAAQWFLFALIIPIGTAALAWSRRRRPRPPTEATT